MENDPTVLVRPPVMGQRDASPFVAAAVEAAELREAENLLRFVISQIDASNLDPSEKAKLTATLRGLSGSRDVGAIRQEIAQVAREFREAGNRVAAEKNAEFAIAKEYSLTAEYEFRYQRVLAALASHDETEIFFAMNKDWDALAKSNPDIKATIESGLHAANKSSPTMHALENANDAVSNEFRAKSMRRQLHNLQTLEELQKDPAYAEYRDALNTMRQHHLFSFAHAGSLLEEIRRHEITPAELTKEVEVMDAQALGLADAVLRESSRNHKGSSNYLRAHFLDEKGKIDIEKILVVKEKMLNDPDLVKDAVAFYNAHERRFDEMEKDPSLYRQYADVIMVLKKGAVVDQAMSYHGVVQAMHKALTGPMIGEGAHDWDMALIFDKGANREQRLATLQKELIEHHIIDESSKDEQNVKDMLDDFLAAADMNENTQALLKKDDGKFMEAYKMVTLARITGLAPEDIAWAYKNDEKLYLKILSLYDASINRDEGDFGAEQQALKEHAALARRKAEGDLPADPAVPGLTHQVAAAARQAAAGTGISPTSPSAATASRDGALAQAAEAFSRSGVTQTATGAPNLLPTGPRTPRELTA